MKAAIYVRISTDKQQCENQLRLLREYASKQDWQIVHEYQDIASGGRSDRDAFQQMFKDASKHHFDCVLFFALDRFSRQGALATLTYLQQLSSYGVGYVSYSEPFLSSLGVFGDAIVALLATLAKQEKIRLRERTLAGLARARSQGRIGGRRRVIGDAERDRIVELRKAGMSFGVIALQTGYKKSTIHLCVKGQ